MAHPVLVLHPIVALGVLFTAVALFSALAYEVGVRVDRLDPPTLVLFVQRPAAPMPPFWRPRVPVPDRLTFDEFVELQLLVDPGIRLMDDMFEALDRASTSWDTV